MDTIRNLAIILAATAVIAASAFLVTRPEHIKTSPNLGAITGPDIASSYLKWGRGLGSAVYPVRNTLSVGTTTSCAIQAPAATSTLESFAAQITGGQQVAVTVNLTKGAAMQASTTALSSNYSLAAGAQLAIVASTTPETNRVIPPNTWVQVNVFGGSGTASSTGNCTAVFRTI
jgi:hypothetical protein